MGIPVYCEIYSFSDKAQLYHKIIQGKITSEFKLN